MENTRRRRIERTPILPERVRRINGQGFCFVPHRFLRNGFFASLSPDELLLYFLLVLAGDRNGVSYYAQHNLCSLLQLPMHIYLAARNGLIDKDLVAFDGIRFQVLSLPSKPVALAARPLRTASDFEDEDPATIRQSIRSSLRSVSGQRR